MSYITNTHYQVKTPGGWQNFDGIKKAVRTGLYFLTCLSGKTLKCTSEHKVKNIDGNFIQVCDLLPGDLLLDDVVLSVTKIDIASDNEEHVFDLINVENGRQYYTNGIVSSNCAFIRDFDEIWTSLYPTLSTGGNAIILSTPNGVGGQYYKLWTEAETSTNDFNPIRLPWTVHPEHDQAWFDKETKNIPKRKVAQEFLCDFISSGDTFLQPSEFDKLRAMIRPPIERTGPQNAIWIWRNCEETRKYVISSDVSRGDAADFSTFHVIDYETCEVVAEFMGKIPPDKLADLLFEYGKIYNDALLCPEQNTFGYFTCTKLKDMGYPRLYYANNNGNPFEYRPINPEQVPGFLTQTKTRGQILAKLEETIRNGKLKTPSQRLYDQLQAFVWNGSKAQASKDAHDDLVMSIAIGIWLACGDGHVGNNGMDMAYAMLAATSKGVRLSTELPGGIDEVRPVQNANMQGFSSYNTAGRQRIKPGSTLDFSWLYK